MKKVYILFTLLFPMLAHAQIITTFAGNGSSGSAGDGWPATAASISPRGCACDRNGNLYFAEPNYNKVRKINAGIITTIAGNGVAGYNGDSLLATIAQLNYPNGIAVDSLGNIFINDSGNYRVRKVNVVTGIITTVAGNGTTGLGFSLGVNATSSSIGNIIAICVDRWDNLYLDDGWWVAKVDTTGNINFVIGGPAASGCILLMGGDDSVPATSAGLCGSNSICVDGSGNVYCGYRTFPDHSLVTYSGLLETNTAGMLFRFAGTGYGGYTGDSGQATNAKVAVSFGLTTDTAENVYFSNVIGLLYFSNAMGGVRRVDPSGMICTVAGNGAFGFSGDGGHALDAQLGEANGITIDRSNNLYICGSNRIRKVIQPECGYVYLAGIGSLEKPAQFSLYPNPGHNELTITSSNKITSITISNVIGQTIFCHEYNSPDVHIDIAALASGIYIIKINNSQVRKFIKE